MGRGETDKARRDDSSVELAAHQLFIAFVNSLGLATLIWIPLVYLGQARAMLGRGALGSLVVFWVSLIANNTYATLRLQAEIAKHRIEIS